MTHREYTNAESSFFWNTDLSEERRQEIVNWVICLTEREVEMLDDLLQDARDDEYYLTNEEA